MESLTSALEDSEVTWAGASHYSEGNRGPNKLGFRDLATWCRGATARQTGQAHASPTGVPLGRLHRVAFDATSASEGGCSGGCVWTGKHQQVVGQALLGKPRASVDLREGSGLWI